MESNKILKIEISEINSLINTIPSDIKDNYSIKEGVIEYSYNPKNMETNMTFFKCLGNYFLDLLTNENLKDIDIPNDCDKEPSDLMTMCLAIKIEQYFQFSDHLKENVFLKFNLKTLNDDVKNMIGNALDKQQFNENLEKIRKKIHQRGSINFDDFAEILLSYDDEKGISIISKKTGETINIDNISRKLGIRLGEGVSFDENLCAVCFLLFNVKKVYLEEDSLGVMEMILQSPIIQGTEVKFGLLY